MVVQFYAGDVVSPVTRPVKELKGFQKIALQPGEKKTVRFTLSPEELSLYDQNMVRLVEPGTFNAMAGSSSEQIRLTGSFEVPLNETQPIDSDSRFSGALCPQPTRSDPDPGGPGGGEEAGYRQL